MINDEKLSDHFSIYDLTATSHAEFQEMNRAIDALMISKLKQVADLWEVIWALTEVPWIISSGYRCPALNQAVGSSLRSQHLLGEAADAVPKGLAVVDAFKMIRSAVKDKKLAVGQLIYEKAQRGYAGGTTEWVHSSLGVPYRPAERCGQILTMVDGSYTLLETVQPD